MLWCEGTLEFIVTKSLTTRQFHNNSVSYLLCHQRNQSSAPHRRARQRKQQAQWATQQNGSRCRCNPLVQGWYCYDSYVSCALIGFLPRSLGAAKIGTARTGEEKAGKTRREGTCGGAVHVFPVLVRFLSLSVWGCRWESSPSAFWHALVRPWLSWPRNNSRIAKGAADLSCLANKLGGLVAGEHVLLAWAMHLPGTFQVFSSLPHDL